MDNIETLDVNPRNRTRMADTLICVDPISRGFLASQSFPSPDVAFAICNSADEIFDILWQRSRGISTTVFDSCEIDVEELLFASLNYPEIFFVVRPVQALDGRWRRRLLGQRNIALPCSDFMIWTYAFSRRSFGLRTNVF